MATDTTTSDPVFRDWLRDILKVEQAVTITFIKTDGTERVMNCTLRPEVVPVPEKKTQKVKNPNPDVISVWDTDNDGWRSIRFDSMKSIKFTLGAWKNDQA